MVHAKPSICFVSHFAYGALSGGQRGHIGGTERQAVLMTHWLAQQGYPVTALTWDEGQTDDLSVDGVRIVKLCRLADGIRGLRFFHPRWSSLVRAMKRADADIYYQNCGEYVTGQVAMWCQRHGRRFVYSTANDTDCDPTLPKLPTLRERILYRYGLRHADRIIVQTRRQQQMLRQAFGHDSTVLPMPCPNPSGARLASPDFGHPAGRRVLWVGRICRQKRPDRLLELAGACSDLQFDLVGPASEGGYSQEILARAGQMHNVTVHGPAPRERMPQMYSRAACLCCTSDYEGFPNTFLEAWSQGLPIVSMFDPDDLIVQCGLGRYAQDMPGLILGLRDLLGSPQRWRVASGRCRTHFLQTYSLELAMPRFERVFQEVLRPAAKTREPASSRWN